MNVLHKRHAAYRGITGLSVFLLIWEAIGRSGLFPPYYLPPFSLVLAQFTSGSYVAEVMGHLAHTVWRAGLGYIIAASIAVPLGIVLGRSRHVLAYVEPILESLRPLPSSAIIPVALLFLGLGWQMIVFVVAFGATWPILVATIQGARNVDPIMLDTAKLLHLSASKTNFYIVLPAALPYIMAGLRTSLAVSLILAVTAEMIAGSNGTGFFILDMERAFRTREMYAAIMVLGIAGYLMNKLFETGERRLAYWEK